MGDSFIIRIICFDYVKLDWGWGLGDGRDGEIIQLSLTPPPPHPIVTADYGDHAAVSPTGPAPVKETAAKSL